MKITPQNSQVKALKDKQTDFSKMPDVIQNTVNQLGILSNNFTEVDQKHEALFNRLDKLAGEKAMAFLEKQKGAAATQAKPEPKDPKPVKGSTPSAEKTIPKKKIEKKVPVAKLPKVATPSKPKVEKSKPKAKPPAISTLTVFKKLKSTSNLTPIEMSLQVLKIENLTQLSLVNKTTLVAKPGDFILVDQDNYPMTIIFKDTDIAKRIRSKEKPLSVAPEKPVSATPPAKKETKKSAKMKSCSTLEQGDIPNVVVWLKGMVEDWKTSHSGKRITKIYQYKKDGKIVVELADYSGAKGLKAFFGQRDYYSLCLGSAKLTKANKPERGMYKLAVSDKELKILYSTKRNWNACAATYSALLKCSMAGSCSDKQKGEWKRLYYSCGDLRKKLEVNPELLSAFHGKVREARRAGEGYFEAMGRVRGMV